MVGRQQTPKKSEKRLVSLFYACYDYIAYPARNKFYGGKSNMKRTFALLLALCMVLSLCACGGTKEEAKTEEPAAEE